MVEAVTMNMTTFENKFYNIPALFVSGSFVVSIVFIIIAIMISVIIMMPPGME